MSVSAIGAIGAIGSGSSVSALSPFFLSPRTTAATEITSTQLGVNTTPPLTPSSQTPLQAFLAAQAAAAPFSNPAIPSIAAQNAVTTAINQSAASPNPTAAPAPSIVQTLNSPTVNVGTPTALTPNLQLALTPIPTLVPAATLTTRIAPITPSPAAAAAQDVATAVQATPNSASATALGQTTTASPGGSATPTLGATASGEPTLGTLAAASTGANTATTAAASAPATTAAAKNSLASTAPAPAVVVSQAAATNPFATPAAAPVTHTAPAAATTPAAQTPQPLDAESAANHVLTGDAGELVQSFGAVALVAPFAAVTQQALSTPPPSPAVSAVSAVSNLSRPQAV